MRTIWHSLVWKEWHEHKWMLAAIMAIVGGSTWFARIGPEAFLFSSIQLAVLMCIVPMSVFVGTATAAGERSRGTLPFLQALPIAPRRVAITKLAAGMTTCLAPPLLVILLLFAWHLTWDWWGVDFQESLNKGWRELQSPLDFDNWFIEFVLVVTLWVVSLFLWTAAVGVNRADEVSAGAVSLSVIAGIWIAMIAVRISHEPFAAWLVGEGKWLLALASAVAPGGLAQTVRLQELGGPIALAVIGLFIVVHSALAAWYVCRFGRVADRRILSPQAAVSGRGRLDWLAPPRRSPLSAIAWKQFRESGPIILAGLSGAAAIVVAAAFASYRDAENSGEVATMMAIATFMSCAFLGGFTTLVVGIGVFLRDLSPGLHTFWRSRPISPHAWYWIKFAMGLVIIMMTFQLPMLAAATWGRLQLDIHDSEQILQIQLVALTIFVAVYAIAVATTCLVRNAVYSAILSIAALYLGPLCVVAVVFVTKKLFGQELPTKSFLDDPENGPFWIAGLVVAALIGTLVGWLAVRYDWGRKSRY